MIAYQGVRLGQFQKLRIFRIDTEAKTSAELNPRLDLYNHSPTGFECGYGGSGPAQTALAILADHLGDDGRAVRLHQAFKFAVIARLERDGEWEISAAQVEAWLDELEEGTA